MTIFWRIFMSFWLATTILLAIVFSTGEVWQSKRWADSDNGLSTLDLNSALGTYEHGNPKAFEEMLKKAAGMERNILLFSADGRLLAPVRKQPSAWAPLVASALSHNSPVAARDNARVALATPIRSDSGQQYVIVMTALRPLHTRWTRPQFWTKLALSMIPATLICLGLALYITRPLLSLSLTARRIAGGELTVSPPAGQRFRRDELGQLSRDIDAMALQIDALLKAQQRFVASVSHELGTPLTRMQLAITLLRREVSSSQPGSLDQIEREADRLGSLVQELLFMASLKEGTVPSEAFVTVSLDSLCRDLVRDNAAELEERECTISAAFAPVSVAAASEALRRAIENVLRNAMRHGPAKSTIFFSCGVSDVAGYVFVDVVDAGPGVAEHMLESIFEPFVRAAAKQAGSEGTGLGLAIAAEAVKLHRGRISATNNPSGGLNVRILIPTKQV